ncbi:uncharacterized protein [Centruroides vittatus]|uniref:uncharacterized protein n=1 Tax=Centruroides vittatus TaxID=120091 RepID=UPI00350F2FEC
MATAMPSTDVRNQPSLGVSVAMHPQTTKAGKPRQRMKWTVEMNEFIIRTYYTITKLETNMTAYRQQLHHKFTQQYPHLTVTEQRVVDQKRTIIHNNLIAQTTLELIKQQVADQIHQQTETSNINEDHVTCQDNPATSIDNNTHTTITTNDTTDTSSSITDNIDLDLVNTLSLIFQETLTKYTGTDPTQRPRIPKINTSKEVGKTLNYVNTHLLPHYIHSISTLADIHTLVYAGAVTVVTHHGLKVQSQTNTQKTQFYHKPAWQRRIETQINDIRQQLGRLTQYTKNNITPKLRKQLKNIFKKIKTRTKHEHHNTHITEYIDTLKQKLAAKAQNKNTHKT